MIQFFKADNSRDYGKQQETKALAYLEKQRLKLVNRNFNCRWGEIDLIMLQPPSSLVFVEVRYRKSDSHGSAQASVGIQKQRRIKRTAAAYLAKHPKYLQLNSRFDVVAICPDGSGSDHIQWIQHAFY